MRGVGGQQKKEKKVKPSDKVKGADNDIRGDERTLQVLNTLYKSPFVGPKGRNWHGECREGCLDNPHSFKQS